MKMKLRVLVIALSILSLIITDILAQASTLVLPDNLQVLEEEAFYGDTSIDEVVLPEGITEIGPRAFANSSLSEIDLPDSLTYIDDTAFDGPDKVTVTANKGTTAFDWAVANGYITVPIESAHPVPYYTDETYTYSYPTTTDYLKITFNYDTYFSYGNGSLTIVDSEGTENTYYDDDLSGVTVIIPGSSFSLHLVSYDCYQYGFKIEQIKPMTETEYQAYQTKQDEWQEFQEVYENLFHFKVKLLDDDTLEISEYTGSDTDVVIPSEIDDKPVVRIGAYAFSMSSLTSISLPETLTNIGDGAFDSCSELRSIKIPYGVSRIGSYTFGYCEKLESVTIPSSVLSIEKRAFRGCRSLTSLAIPNGVKRIAEEAFMYTGLTRITIPASVTYIEAGAFEGATVSTVTVAASNPAYTTIDGVLFDKSKKTLLYYPCTYEGAYVVPNSVESIDRYAFWCCEGLTSITLPNYLTSINGGAFGGCSSLTRITIPESVGFIGTGAFLGCSSLTTVSIPDGVSRILSSTFDGCTGLTSITISDSVICIENYAFYDCDSLLDVYYSGSQELWKEISIATGNDSLTNATIHYMAINTVADSFEYSVNSDGSTCTVTSYTGNGGAVRIPAAIVGYPVVGVGKQLFSDNDTLTSVTIPDGVTDIGIFAFYNCDNLSSVTMPDSINSIGSYAFNGCTRLTDIYYSGTATQYSAISIGSNNQSLTSATKHYSYTQPVSSVFEYTANSDGTTCTISKYTGNGGMVNIPASIDGYSVTGIGKSAFANCIGLTSVSIPDTVTEIGYKAFYNCNSLACITIPDGVTAIGGRAFMNCDMLAEIIIPDSVVSIGEYAFYACTTLSDIYYHGAAQQWSDIGIGAGNQPLTDVYMHFAIPYTYSINEDGITCTITGYNGDNTAETIPSIIGVYTVSGIDQFAFEGCDGLESITIPESVVSIENGAFRWCNNLNSIQVATGNPNYTSVNGVLYDKDGSLLICCPSGKSGICSIPSSVIRIGDYAFSDCEALTNIFISNNVQSIGACAFYCCSSLTSVSIPNGVTSIGDEAFGRCYSLTSIALPEGITNIGENAFLFDHCDSLISITIPSSMISIGANAFGEVDSLESFVVASGNQRYVSQDGVLFDKVAHILIEYPRGTSGDYTVPSWVTTIGEWAFSYCTNLKNVTIPEGVTGIGEYAFYHCEGMRSITIPTSMTTIGGNAFAYCESLKTTSYFGNEEQWAAINIANGNELLTLVVDFSEWINIGDTISFGSYYWIVVDDDGSRLTLICECAPTIKSYGSVWTWLNNRFLNTAFSAKERDKLVPADENPLDSIGSYYNAQDKVFIPSVSEVYKWFTSDVSRACKLTYSAYCLWMNDDEDTDVDAWEEDDLYFRWWLRTPGNTSGRVAYVNANGRVSENGENTSERLGVRPVIVLRHANPVLPRSPYSYSINSDGITCTITGYDGNDGDESIPSTLDGYSVIGIEDGAFSGCTGLTGIAIPEGVTIIGNDAFAGCSNMVSVTIPKSMTTIGQDAFRNCGAIEVVSYNGTQQQWAAIDIGDGNQSLMAALEYHVSYNIGDTVTFGAYEQDNDTSNGEEPIEWIVLDRNGRSALFLSKHCLEARPYNTQYTSVTWETCTLRSWLNSSFLNTAFTTRQQQGILLTNVDNDMYQGYDSYDTDGGNNTQDRIFLLSYNEAWTYLGSKESRMSAPTDYAVAQGATISSDDNVNGRPTGWWWLRSPGSRQNIGTLVYGEGSLSYARVDRGFGVVRPALWIDLDSGVLVLSQNLCKLESSVKRQVVKSGRAVDLSDVRLCAS